MIKYRNENTKVYYNNLNKYEIKVRKLTKGVSKLFS